MSISLFFREMFRICTIGFNETHNAECYKPPGVKDNLKQAEKPQEELKKKTRKAQGAKKKGSKRAE
ncbi:MAG: hypothetical protein ACQESR_21515 [Planctomycetota bacterium]